MPQGYFDKETVDALTALRERTLSDRRQELLADFPTAILAGKVKNTWRSTAACLYRNWLLYLHEKKKSTARISDHATLWAREAGLRYQRPLHQDH